MLIILLIRQILSSAVLSQDKSQDDTDSICKQVEDFKNISAFKLLHYDCDGSFSKYMSGKYINGFQIVSRPRNFQKLNLNLVL